MRPSLIASVAIGLAAVCIVRSALAEGEWETAPESEQALARGLDWLARNQSPEGNWTSNDLGLVAMGALAFMADGHLPGRGGYGENVERALGYIIRNTRESGLFNIAEAQHDMYNHGLSTFVLGQVYGMTGDPKIGRALDRGLQLIADTQAGDGGWDYQAHRVDRGHDLSLAVMQAKALRSAVDVGLDVRPEVVRLAIESVRRHYTPDGVPYDAPEEEQKSHPGQFRYTPQGQGSIAMAAAGVVCLQEFAQYDDWRIAKNMDVICKAITEETHKQRKPGDRTAFDAYTLYYVGQALYQVGGDYWKTHYPELRDSLVACQVSDPENPQRHGMWVANERVYGRPGELYMTSAACFILAMPNRYLPILQEGKIESLEEQFQTP